MLTHTEQGQLESCKDGGDGRSLLTAEHGTQVGA